MLTRKHVMCADLDPQGYAHMQDELQETGSGNAVLSRLKSLETTCQK